MYSLSSSWVIRSRRSSSSKRRRRRSGCKPQRQESPSVILVRSVWIILGGCLDIYVCDLFSSQELGHSEDHGMTARGDVCERSSCVISENVAGCCGGAAETDKTARIANIALHEIDAATNGRGP